MSVKFLFLSIYFTTLLAPRIVLGTVQALNKKNQQ